MERKDTKSYRMNAKMALMVFSPRSITCSKAGGAEIYVHEIMNRIALKRYNVLVVSSSDGRIKGGYDRLKYKEIIVSRSELLFPFASLKLAKQIKHFDIIVENISKFPLLWPLLLSKILRKTFVAIVHHIHGGTLFNETPWLVALILYFYEIFSLKLYSFIKAFTITVSESTKQELIKLGFSGAQISVIGCGVNLNSTDLQSGINSRDPLIVYVGRVKRYKRLEDFLRAMSIVRQEEPNIRCIVAGKGDEKVHKKLRSLADILGFKNVIKLMKEVDEKRKLDILKSAWVYVMPSMKEGFSISALEAQSFGVPVVGYKVPGIVNCVKDGVTGFLVSNGDFKALANAILTLIKNKELRYKMSNEARIRASKFKWDTSAEKFLGELESLVKRRAVNDRF